MFSYTDFRNPFLTNYEIRLETNFAARTKFIYNRNFGKQQLRLVGGAEWESFYSPDDNYGNREGIPDTVQTKDRLWTTQIFPFAQVELEMAKKFLLQAGASTNLYGYHYQRLTDPNDSKKEKKFDAQFLPRFSALYHFVPGSALYMAISKGYSPPTIAEVRPSEGSFYTNLQPEFGWNFELGLRGSIFQRSLQFDLTAYQFKLKEAIVRRTDISGAEYFINSGGTNQKGFEGLATYWFPTEPLGFIHSARVWTSYALNNFDFTNYKMDNNDYSGNAVTGVPQRVWVSGLDISSSQGLYLNATFNYTSRLPLNDANDEFASDYRILQGRLGWKHKFLVIGADLFIGIDNALNQLYSLGNDINAFGRRYYNPAPARNYFGGLILDF